MRRYFSPGVILGTLALVFAITGSAVAGSLITSSQIKDGTIRGKDIHKNTITLNRLAPSVQKLIRAKTTLESVQGPKGDTGATGAQGPAGTPATNVLGSQVAAVNSGNWGVIDRNTIGSPQVSFRSGPATPPFGKGALDIEVGSSSEKAAYGDEVDAFANGLVDDLDQVGFQVYTTQEDIAAGNGTANMPSIAFEIDPNLSSVNSSYSSLVYMPSNSAPDQWSGYIDATKTGLWGLTGSKFAGTECDINGPRCTFAQVKAYLDDGGTPATILTAAITKGRDYPWQGAVDGLRVNNTVYDFEETGVVARPAS